MRRTIADIVELVFCPYCNGRLHTAEKFDIGAMDWCGVLECECYRYAVLDGIPILRQLSPVGSHEDPVVDCLTRGNVEQAMQVAGAKLLPRPIAKTGPVSKIMQRLGAGHGGSSHGDVAQDRILEALKNRTFREALYAMKLKSYADYLYYRFANNSYMAAFVFAMLLRELQPESPGQKPAVLDLACGIGHTASLVNGWFPEIDVVGVDFDFGNLCLAKNHVAPDTTFICLDAEMRLPFPADSFAACLALDGLHYIRGKVNLLAELDRILTHDALWLFPHLHNRLQENAAPGVPLSPDGWTRLLDFLPHRLLTERALLTDFIERDECDLSVQPPLSSLHSSRSLAAIATRRDDFWRSHDGLVERSINRLDGLVLNPILALASSGPAGVKLETVWPTAEMKEECSYSLDVFPASQTLSDDEYRSIGRWSSGKSAEAVRLANRFVAVAAPSCYAESPVETS